MPLSVGTRAPLFTLRTLQNGEFKDVSLEDNLGEKNTVLLFFPGAFTPPCTEEMCLVNDWHQTAAGLDAVVWGISCDTAFAQAAWAKQEKIEIPLLADYTKEVATQYDVLLPSLAGMGPSAARAAFVVNRHGIIRYAEQTETPLTMPNFEAVKTALENERE